ncbi:MAG: hypothetical protein JO087_17955 [Actinobacteria bacterium]|nr:hypothetical protein [Actinomycetota bacterium]
MSEQGPEGNGVAEDRPRGVRRMRNLIRGNSTVDPRNVGQLVGGGLLMAGGLVVILLSWYGSAHTAYVQQQVPYLVSGSFIGLGMMIIGGLLFWAHWLYRIYDQADLHHQEIIQQQREMTAAVLEALSAAPASSRGRAAAVVASKASSTASVSSYVATSAGSNFHVASCPIVSKSRNGLRKVTAREAASMQPCRICEPLTAAAPA